MTAKEIVEKLEYLLKLGDAPIGDCFGVLIDKKTISEALELINTQQEKLKVQANNIHALLKMRDVEIERLKTEKDNLIKTYSECQIDFLKEFAVNLKLHASTINLCGHKHEIVPVRAIDSVLERMVGGADNG